MRLFCVLLVIRNILPMCEETEFSKGFLKAYNDPFSLKNLGKGGNGVVEAIIFEKKEYAVKSIDINSSFGMIKTMTEVNKEGKIKFDDFIFNFKKSCSFQNMFCMEGLENYTDKCNFYYNHIKAKYESVLSEVEQSILASKCMEESEENSFKYHFCVKHSDYTFLLVFDRYGESLGSENSKIFFSKATFQVKLDIYLKIIWAVLNLHSKNIFHCDLKQENILWEEVMGEGVVIIDFGFGTSQKCAKATRGYNAPERFSQYGESEELGSKADVYSLGIIFGIIEYESMKKKFEFHDELFRVETSLGSRRTKTNPLEELKKYNPIKFSLNVKDYKEEIIQDLLTDFEKCLSEMLVYDPHERITLPEAYIKLWLIYRRSKILEKTQEKVDETLITVNKEEYIQQIKFLHSKRNEAVGFFDKDSEKTMLI